MNLRFWTRVIVVVVLGLSNVYASGQTAVSISIDPSSLISPIPISFEGLSVEAGMIRSGGKAPYFYAGNTNLVRLFRTMGVKSLRMGGNSVDNLPYNAIDNSDIDHLFSFAEAARVKVIFSFGLKNSNSTSIAYDIAQAKYILEKYSQHLDCFCLGNEPGLYPATYEQYLALWQPFFNELISACPNSRVCAPSNSTNALDPQSAGEYFARAFSENYAGNSPANIAYLSQHEYTIGSAKNQYTSWSAIRRMLERHDGTVNTDRTYTAHYQNLLTSTSPLIVLNDRPYRLEETNSFAGGGIQGASDVYSAAIWGLDYQYWWASHHAIGMNFHTGYSNTAAGPDAKYYSAFASASNAPEAAQTPWGLAYALLSFRLGSRGYLVRCTTDISDPSFVFTAYAVMRSNHSLYVTVINRDYGYSVPARSAQTTISLPSDYVVISVQSIGLGQINRDVTVKTGITVGGDPIQSDGSWLGVWSPVSNSAISRNTLQVTVDPASATVYKISLRKCVRRGFSGSDRADASKLQ